MDPENKEIVKTNGDVDKSSTGAAGATPVLLEASNSVKNDKKIDEIKKTEMEVPVVGVTNSEGPKEVRDDNMDVTVAPNEPKSTPETKVDDDKTESVVTSNETKTTEEVTISKDNKIESLPTVDEKKPGDATSDSEIVTLPKESDAQISKPSEASPQATTNEGQQQQCVFLKPPTPTTVVEPGVKDKEGFLAPPSPSTLLIRRARTNSTGTPTYVVSNSSGKNNPGPSTSSGRSSGKPGPSSSPLKRRPGRPVGSIGSYKKKRIDAAADYKDLGPGEVRISSRMSTSVFKHDPQGHSSPISPADNSSPYIYPTAYKASFPTGGKPPMTGYRKHSSKGSKKELLDNIGIGNIDPLTGKRRYTRRKKHGGDEREIRESERIIRRDTLPTEDNNSVDSDTEKEKTKMHLSDNGVWRPTDDLRLLVNMKATGDLESVFTGVRFSCFFTFKDIEERWRKLLYGEKASMVSQNAINALHPDVKAKIYHEALFNEEEETLIATVKPLPNANPDIKSFQTLLDENPNVFGKHRTARSLMMHWLNMKDFFLLPHQNVLEYEPELDFEDMEEVVCDEIAPGSDEEPPPDDEAVDLELKTEERLLKKKMILLEDEIAAWQMLTNQIIDDGMKNRSLPPKPTDFDSKTFALLRGREVYYGMTSREITLGRSTNDCKVDADLTEEGCSSKVSRKQAIIRLKNMGKFSIINKGKRTIFVDRKAIPYRCAATLHDQSIIQIAQISLIFFVNKTVIDNLLDADVTREIYASFKDLEADMPPSKKSPSPGSPEGSISGIRRSFLSPYSSLGRPSPSPLLLKAHSRNMALSLESKLLGAGSTSLNYTHLTQTSASATSTEAMDVDESVPINLPPASYVTVASSSSTSAAGSSQI